MKKLLLIIAIGISITAKAQTFNFLLNTAATVVTPQTLVQSSGIPGIRNYINALTISTDALGAVGNVWVLDGSLTVSSFALTTGLVTTSSNHDLKIGDAVVFTALSGGSAPGAVNTVYYVISIPSALTFTVSATIGGTAIVPTTTWTAGVAYRVLNLIRLQTTALIPTQFVFLQPLRTNGNAALNFMIPTSLTSGNIYISVDGQRSF